MASFQDRGVTGLAWIGMCALLASACGDSFEATAAPPAPRSKAQTAEVPAAVVTSEPAKPVEEEAS